MWHRRRTNRNRRRDRRGGYGRRRLGEAGHLVVLLFVVGQLHLNRAAVRQVAVRRVVGAGVVGDSVGTNAARDQPRQDLGGVAEQRDRLGLTGAGVLLD